MKRFLPIVCLLAFLVGCAEDMNTTMETPPPMQQWGQVVIQRTLHSPNADWHAEAWFAEYDGVDEAALKQAMDVNDGNQDEGCVWRSVDNTTATEGTVRFRAIGGARIRNDAGDVFHIAPHALVLHADDVQGVVYAGNVYDPDTTSWTLALYDASADRTHTLQQSVPEGWGIVGINGEDRTDDTIYVSTSDDLLLDIDGTADEHFAVLSTDEAPDRQLICGIRDGVLSISSAQRHRISPSGEAIRITVVLRNTTPLPTSTTLHGRFDLDLQDDIWIRTAP